MFAATLRWRRTLGSPREGCQRSGFRDRENGFGKGLRGFLRQIVSDTALDGSVRILAGELIGVGARLGMRSAVRVAFHRDGRHSDDRGGGQPLLEVVVLALAVGEAEPPAVVMDRDGDMIRVVEGGCAAVERGIVEPPLRRSDLPDELCEVVRVFRVAGTAAFRGEIELVPPLELRLWRQRILAGFL